MAESKIEWTERTWNPVVGCSIVSPGCTNCYAMKMAARIEAMSEALYDAGKITPPAQYNGTTKKQKGRAIWTGHVAMAPDHILLEPLKRKKPTTYFVNSMGDLFHENVPDEWIDRVFAVMALCPQHTFQVLTKRAERMRDYITDSDDGRGHICSIHRVWDIADTMTQALLPEGHPGWQFVDLAKHEVPWPLPNVWLGVSTERQQEADERIPLLLQTPAAIRFISAEPLIGPVNLRNLGDVTMSINAFTGEAKHLLGMRDKTAGGLDWVICGGESGPGARPMHPQWARDLEAQCRSAGVKFFFKQWGAWAPQFDECGGQHPAAKPGTDVHQFMHTPHFGTSMVRVGKKRAGRLLDGKEHNGFPQMREAAFT